MAIVFPKFSGRRLSPGRSVADSIAPALGIRLLSLQHALEPGELLEFSYLIQRVAAESIERVEVSVAWYTEGKGTEDIGVHFFESLPRTELCKRPLGEPHHVAIHLPASPLSFSGKLFKLRWCIRLRLFLNDGREFSAERPFFLGHVTNEI